jgi:hypothetical protein
MDLDAPAGHDFDPHDASADGRHDRWLATCTCGWSHHHVSEGGHALDEARQAWHAHLRRVDRGQEAPAPG